MVEVVADLKDNRELAGREGEAGLSGLRVPSEQAQRCKGASPMRDAPDTWSVWLEDSRTVGRGCVC